MQGQPLGIEKKTWLDPNVLTNLPKTDAQWLYE